ncbi:hypothetical protein PS3A_43480 [Pseudomonas sp. 3A(2025)]
MTRGQVYQRLELAWWRQLGLTLAPLLVACVFFTVSEPGIVALLVFLAGIGSLFISFKLYGAFKRALELTRNALDTPDEPAAWLRLAAVRRTAFLAASLPAWFAAVGILFSLHAVAVVLLALASLGMLGVYRIPRLVPVPPAV